MTKTDWLVELITDTLNANILSDHIDITDLATSIRKAMLERLPKEKKHADSCDIAFGHNQAIEKAIKALGGEDD